MCGPNAAATPPDDNRSMAGCFLNLRALRSCRAWTWPKAGLAHAPPMRATTNAESPSRFPKLLRFIRLPPQGGPASPRASRLTCRLTEGLGGVILTFCEQGPAGFFSVLNSGPQERRDRGTKERLEQIIEALKSMRQVGGAGPQPRVRPLRARKLGLPTKRVTATTFFSTDGSYWCRTRTMYLYRNGAQEQ
jgi:hypothetical protein